MNRAFISLYLIIVLSILLLGLALNKFWDQLNVVEEVDPAIVDILQLVEQAAFHDGSINQTVLDSIAQGLHHKLQLRELSDFAQTKMRENIQSGKIVTAETDTSAHYYRKISNSSYVIELINNKKPQQNNLIYIGFTVIFYSLLALAIFLWVWPLSRDLARLAKHTREAGKDGIPNSISISSRSVVYPFASAFNAMTKRLNSILHSYREMTYAVSHELRTPLARMKFALAMMEEGQLPSPAQKHIHSLQQDIADMESLINSLLTYAGFENGSHELHQCEGHMGDLLQAIIARLKAGQHRPLSIEVVDSTANEVFCCEWALMQTALQNLLENAAGFARSRVQVLISSTPDNYIITVNDDGIGVPESQRERIFDAFVRILDEHSNRSGFGLGLAIVKRIMSWHRGSISCQEADIGGASFILAWPKPKHSL